AETEKREAKRTEEMKQRNIMPGVEVLIAKQWGRIYVDLNICTAFICNSNKLASLSKLANSDI
ncbi:MAG: hypothetical protein KKC02_11105, partial [Gammaproteobacteria bacterium]|nr:hypothetical protein [Gammaproteobacteria bacterium]